MAPAPSERLVRPARPAARPRRCRRWRRPGPAAPTRPAPTRPATAARPPLPSISTGLPARTACAKSSSSMPMLAASMYSKERWYSVPSGPKKAAVMPSSAKPPTASRSAAPDSCSLAELHGHRVAGPVPRHRHGAVPAVDRALPEMRARSRRDVGELDEHAGLALVEPDQRVVAGRAEDAGLEVVDPGRGRSVRGAAPDRLGDEGGSVGGLQVAEEVVEDVQEVHAHVQGHRTRLADVAPRADEDLVAAADAGLDHRVHVAEEPRSPEHGARAGWGRPGGSSPPPTARRPAGPQSMISRQARTVIPSGFSQVTWMPAASAGTATR